MAGLVRLGAIRHFGNTLARSSTKGRRSINTSSKKTSVESEVCAVPKPEKKNWICYGFSKVDPFVDRLSMHVTTFVTVSVGLVFGGFFLTFVPDPNLAEWAQREGYLELRRRESQGLLPIDPWYINPDKIVLPTDEELGNTEIII